MQLAILDRDLTAPPGAPSEGQRWIVAASPTGAWAGHASHIAAWQDGGWQFSAPKTGWITYVADEGTLLVWNGTAWGDFFSAVTSIQNLARLGVGTTADSTNPFSVKLNNTLWTGKTVAEGGDGNLRYKLSKESASKTLSFLFQDNFSGRAEIGLTGDDDFHFKTSPDGSAWTDAVTIDKTTGSTKINTGLFLAGDLSPSQVTADQNDYNPAGLSTASVLRLSTDARRSITGLAGGGDGRVISIVNVGSNGIVLKNASSSSSAANRFALALDLLLNAGDGAILWYDATDSRWKLLAPRAAGREVLTANRTYYVRTDGSDSNPGLVNSSAGAFLTIQAAWNKLVTLDLNGFVTTIQIGDGTYTSGLNANVSPVGGTVVINGNSATPANVIISTSGDPFGFSAPCQVTIQNLEIRSSAGYGLNVSGGANVTMGVGMRYGACAVAHIRAKGTGYIILNSNYSIVGAASGHYLAEVGGCIEFAVLTVTNVGTNAFAGGFASATSGGVISAYPSTWTGGTITGPRYSATLGGIINTFGGGANYFPGNSAGTTSSGGQYL